MNRKMIGSFLLLLAACAYAYDRDSDPPSLGRETNILGCTQGTLDSPPSTEYGGYVEVDYLYWLPYEEGLEYAFKQNSPSSTPAGDTDSPLLLANTVGGHFARIDFDWQSAFRLEAGYALPDDWKIFARWTRFKENVESHAIIDSISTQDIAAIWLGAEFFSAGYLRALSADATWSLHYNILDSGLSRTFNWGKNLVLTPQTGIRGFWINQRFAVDYAGGDITGPANFKGINNFGGAGLFGQFNTQWFFHPQWCIVGEFLGSINFGRLKLGQQTVSQIQLTSEAPTRNVIHEVVHRTRFAYQAGIGLEWSKYFYPCKTRKATISAKYELCEWFHLNQLRRFAYSDDPTVDNFIPMEGNLGFQGVSLTARFDY